MTLGRTLTILGIATLLLGTADACSSGMTRGSETNWLGRCDNGERCGEGLVCQNGECVRKLATATLPESAPSTTYVFVMAYDGDVPSTSVFPNKCLYMPIPVDGANHVPCQLIEYSPVGTACDCAAPGREALSVAELTRMRELAANRDECGGSTGVPCDPLCGCAVSQMTGSALDRCRSGDALVSGDAGWCYMDPGAPIASDCSPGGVARFDGTTPDSHIVLDCAVPSAPPAVLPPQAGLVGDACTPLLQASANFLAFTPLTFAIEPRAPDCQSGVCLVANFGGRTDCPYGQEELKGTSCLTSGTDPTPINGQVMPQGTNRRPADHVYCSCRCDGPEGTGPFCDCPSGFECRPLPLTGGSPVDAGNPVAGSYCTKPGAFFSEVGGLNPDCDPSLANCGG